MIIVPMPVFLAGKGATLEDAKIALNDPSKALDGEWEARSVRYDPVLKMVIIEVRRKQE